MMAEVNLVRIPVHLGQLALYAQDRGWTARRSHESGREISADFDDGRALHHVLSETFGKSILKPFRIFVPRGRNRGSVYAYTSSSKDALVETARTPSCPTLGTRIFSLDQLDTTQMPQTWRPKRRLAFDLRIRPTVRIKNPLPDPRNPTRNYAAGAELDAFFVEAQRKHSDARPGIVDHKPTASGMAKAGRSREAVYLDWLAARLGDAASLDFNNTSLAQFERRRVARGGSSLEGPDAVIHGNLSIKDSEAFAKLVAHGIGRHRSFGYGMLLLRPPKRS